MYVGYEYACERTCVNGDYGGPYKLPRVVLCKEYSNYDPDTTTSTGTKNDSIEMDRVYCNHDKNPASRTTN